MTARLPRQLASRCASFDTREEWLEARRTMAEFPIGGSDVSKILAIAPPARGTGWDVFAEKRHGMVPERTEEEEADLARGRAWEPFVLARYAEKAEVTLLDIPEHMIVRHAEHPWALASPDALVRNGKDLGGAEGKTDRIGTGWTEESGLVIEQWGPGCEQIVRPDYAVQVYFYMEVLALPWWDLAVAIPRANDFPEVIWVRLMADAFTQHRLMTAIGTWRERHLVNGEEPPVDASGAVSRWSARQFRAEGKRIRSATPEETALAAELAWVKAQRKALKGRADVLKNALILSFGDTYGVELGEKGPRCLGLRIDGRVTYNSKRLRADFPEAAKACERVGTPTRQIRLYGFDQE